MTLLNATVPNDRPFPAVCSVVEPVVDRLTRLDAAAELPFDGRVPTDSRYVVDDILDEIARSRPTVTDVVPLPPDEVAELAHHAPPGLSCAATRLDLRSELGIDASVWVAISDAGRLSGVRLRVESPTRLTTLTDLHAALRIVDPSVAVFSTLDHHTNGPGLPTAPTKDLASVSKIFILDAVLDAVRRGRLSLDHRHRLRASDLCPLSAGLTERHVGLELSVADLCRLMVLRSDNTAADVLLAEVGPDAVVRLIDDGAPDSPAPSTFPSMRELIDRAWGIGSPSTPPPTHGTDLVPVHARRLGHFVPLDRLAAAFARIATSPWTPWPPSARPTVWYKGGAAPGAVSAAWYLPDTDRLLAVAANLDRPYGALEDLYVRQCGDAVLAHVLADRSVATVTGGTPVSATTPAREERP